MMEVRRVFPSFVSEAIFNNPLSSQGSNDSRFWHENPKGIYFVKEGYAHEMNLHATPPNQSSLPNSA